MKNMKKKSILLLISVAVLLLGAVGVTVAYLTTQTPPIENTFTPAEVGVKVEDEVKNHVKKNVEIFNTKDVPVFVRVAVVANWCDEDGNPIAYGEDKDGEVVSPWNDHDAIKALAGSNWDYHDGYYYYKGILDVKDSENDSVVFFEEYPTEGYPLPAAPVKPSKGHLEMQIIAQAIQAEPASARRQAWNYPSASSGN